MPGNDLNSHNIDSRESLAFSQNLLQIQSSTSSPHGFWENEKLLLLQSFSMTSPNALKTSVSTHTRTAKPLKQTTARRRQRNGLLDSGAARSMCHRGSLHRPER